VFFDLKNRQIGLQPIKNFQRIVDIRAKRFHYLCPPNEEEKYIITKMGNYNGNYFYTAGLRAGDEVVTVNGVSPQGITTWEQKEAIFKGDTIYYDIVRTGKPLKIAVPVDKNEVQED
jgi:hypothetical protein